MSNKQRQDQSVTPASAQPAEGGPNAPDPEDVATGITAEPGKGELRGSPTSSSLRDLSLAAQGIQDEAAAKQGPRLRLVGWNPSDSFTFPNDDELVTVTAAGIPVPKGVDTALVIQLAAAQGRTVLVDYPED